MSRQKGPELDAKSPLRGSILQANLQAVRIRAVPEKPMEIDPHIECN
jgi:hypothetical protein